MILQVWSAFPTSPISQLRTSMPQKIKWLKVLLRPTSVLDARWSEPTVQNVIITPIFWSTSEAASQKTWATLRSGQYYSFIMLTFGKNIIGMYMRANQWTFIREILISSIPTRNSHVSIYRHWRLAVPIPIPSMALNLNAYVVSRTAETQRHRQVG